MTQGRLPAANVRGFTLIELMVAMLLGLVVIAGVGSVFLSNQRVYRTNRALSEVQDNSRTAFEMLARDIRNAGLTACSNSSRVSNVLNAGPVNGGTTWWADWNNAVRGYAGNDSNVPTGTGEGDRVAGTPSVQLIGGDEASFSVATHTPSTATFTLNESNPDLNAKGVYIVCDFDHAAIFKASSFNNGAKTLGHATTGGNCSAGLGYPTVCTGTANTYTFGTNSLITQLNASDWYVGKNPAGGTSLYRLARNGDIFERQEMVRGVTSMALAYHQPGLADQFVAAGDVTNWTLVSSVRVTLTMQSSDGTAGAAPITRSFTTTTTLRNRVL
ncbi:PilW family protein [Dyella japonica]|uniref:Type IV pilus assembly protein PilW n=1 Tax=Dyella japonica TaxID=231455 RepID=A0ABV2JRE5_9GAMM